MLKNFKIGTRLCLGFGILLVLMLVVGGYGIKSIKALHEEVDLLVEDRMVKVEQANAIIDQINIVARAIRNMIIDDNIRRTRQRRLSALPMPAKPPAACWSNSTKPLKATKGVAILNKIIKDIRPVFGRHLEAIIGIRQE